MTLKPLKRRSALKRKTRLKPMSNRRRSEALVYSLMRKQFLALRPVCEAHAIIHGDEVVLTQSSDVHHVHKRGKNYLNKDTWMAVCRDCHERIENNKKWARQNGLLK